MKQKLIFALDTSSILTSIAVYNPDSKEILSKEFDEANSHNELLASAVHDLFKVHNLNIAEIDQILLGAGPGSFTGLRIGFSFAKGLAQATSSPVSTISSFAAYLSEADNYSLIAAFSDARRKELFCSFYGLDLRKDCKGEWKKLLTPGISSYSDFLSDLKKLQKERGINDRKTLLCGFSSNEIDDALLVKTDRKQPSDLAKTLLLLYLQNQGEWALAKELNEVAMIAPDYQRAVAAKTIKERREEAIGKSPNN